MNIVAKLISTCHEYIKNVTHFNLLKFILGMQYCSTAKERKEGWKERRKDGRRGREKGKKEEREGGESQTIHYTRRKE